jgi:3-methyladenine DNA glycosylase AlkD
MNADEDLIRLLQAALEQGASPETKDWWEKYLRNVIEFRGIGIPQIRVRLAQWRDEVGIANWEKPDQLRIALRLFESPVAEDKLAGILFLQEYLYDQFEWQALLTRYEQLYARDLIFDWNTCDWFCVRVLGPTIRRYGLACARAIAGWHRASNLWQARSSVVAFVPVAVDGRYHPLIYESCDSLIRRDERFAKTAVGWILRDLSRHDENGVEEFVESHVKCFSIESLRNALKYFPDSERTHYVARLRAG